VDRPSPSRPPPQGASPPPAGGAAGRSPFLSYEEFSKPNQAQWWKGQQRTGAQVGGDIRGSGQDSYYGWLGNAGSRNVRGDQPSWFQSYEDWSRPGQAGWFKNQHGSDRGAYGHWLARKNQGGF
jgi:hypothetical protein